MSKAKPEKFKTTRRRKSWLTPTGRVACVESGQASFNAKRRKEDRASCIGAAHLPRIWYNTAHNKEA